MRFVFHVIFSFTILFLAVASCDRAPVPDQNQELPNISEPTLSDHSELNDEAFPPELYLEFDTQSLFIPVKSPDTLSDNLANEQVLGFSYIKFNSNIWDPEYMQINDQFIIQLPGDIEVTATVLRVQQPLSSITSVTAGFQGTPEGSVILSYDSGRTIGSIEITDQNRNFQIRYDSNSDLHYLMEVDPAKLEEQPGSEPLEVGNNEQI
jgi:hypothetical protein